LLDQRAVNGANTARAIEMPSDGIDELVFVHWQVATAFSLRPTLL